MPTRSAGEFYLPTSTVEAEHRRGRRPRKVWSWVWMTLVCLLFTTSGLVRVWQDWRFDTVKNQEVKLLFPLAKLPRDLGAGSIKEWHALPDTEAVLDPQIARVAGSVDSLVRVYRDDLTGVAVTVLVLYGRAETITRHTPQVCYPSAGYGLVDGGEVISVPTNTGAGGVPAAFLGLVFAKKGGMGDREEVYYSFRHEDQWTPGVEGNWRALRYSPGAFKIQVQRKVTDTEYRHLDNPSSRFLSVLMPTLEGLVNDSLKKQPQAPTPKKS
jgi:Protein of unknown function (DUF3485)